MIHIFIGTKAQYIKTAPVMREMDRRTTPYRLIDSGQHGEFARNLRDSLGVREPDMSVGGSRDITTIAAASRWAVSLALQGLGRQRLTSQVFDGDGDGICVVHGDTPTTLLSAMLAKRAGLKVAHLESGLRSRSMLHPFPEELIRLAVMRTADVLFAPDDTAIKNLGAMPVRGAVVPTNGNTSIEGLAHALGAESVDSAGPVIMTTHRVENLKRRTTMLRFVSLLESVAADRRTAFVMHRPTEAALDKLGLMERVRKSRADILQLVDHGEFSRMIAHAPFVISDGGSIQEECALLGVPTLVWRKATERPDGIGQNVVLADFDASIIAEFLGSHETLRRPPKALDATPSRRIVDVLEGWS